MRDDVLWRKTARIITILAEKLSIAPEHAMDSFYNSETYKLFCNPESGLQLMSDYYIVEDLIRELQSR
ncbi:MAG: DUF3791 domain-containing protein [Prevotella sp.]|nr:DUF3791 domain-containing protein [Prevotella sp.]